MPMPSNRRAQKELAVDSTDRLFIERERNKYASHGLALVVLLNGIGALVLLALLAQDLATNNVKAFADAMMVLSGGALLGLISALIAYVNRTIRLEWPQFTSWRRPLRWLATAAAILAAACFFVGMNITGISIKDDATSTTRPKTISPQPPPPTEPQTTNPPTEPPPVEPRATEPQTEPQPQQGQPIEPQPQQEPNKPQTTKPPTTEPQPLEPQQTEPQQLRETKGVMRPGCALQRT
jgi:outer membrane biosynthesis protein TonB